MKITDESQTYFSIYRTEVGSFAIGDALTDEHLLELCRDHGDAYASLKFMVSHTSAAVHESPLDSSYSQKFYTILPPVVVPRAGDVYSPVRSQHPSGSPPRNLPQECGGGYDASISDDNAHTAERDPNQATIKPGSSSNRQRIIPPSLLPRSAPSVAGRGPETQIFVTADSETFKVVDITGARDAAFIWERIFSDVSVCYSCW